MRIITDNPAFAGTLIPTTATWRLLPASVDNARLSAVLPAVFGGRQCHVATGSGPDLFEYALVTPFAARSHYDILMELTRRGTTLPGLLCLAGSGHGFHGQGNRSWLSPPGNIYLSAHLVPQATVPAAGAGLSILACLAAARAVERLAGFRRTCRIKWVNDLFCDGRKLGGVLTHTQIQDGQVTGLICGLGLNVLSPPPLPAQTAGYSAAALAEFVRGPKDRLLQDTCARLVTELARYFRRLQTEGIEPLLTEYRRRLLYLDEPVAVHPDLGDAGTAPDNFVTGIFRGVTDNLELMLEGTDRPIRKGRLRPAELTDTHLIGKGMKR